MKNEKLKRKNSNCRTCHSSFIIQHSPVPLPSSAVDHRLPGFGLPQGAGRGYAAGLVLAGGVDKRLEQRVGREGARLELGMELATHEPRVVADLDNLDVSAIRRVARNGEAVSRQRLFVFAVEFVAVTVPLRDFERPVGLVRDRTGLHARGPGA